MRARDYVQTVQYSTVAVCSQSQSTSRLQASGRRAPERSPETSHWSRTGVNVNCKL